MRGTVPRPSHCIEIRPSPRARTEGPGFSVSRNESSRRITPVRSVRCRGVPWGRLSPLASKELKAWAAATGTAVVVSKPSRSGWSASAPPPRWLCGPPPSEDVVDKSVGRILAAPDLCEWPSKRLGSACCAAGYPRCGYLRLSSRLVFTRFPGTVGTIEGATTRQRWPAAVRSS